ncbi:substrate-binding periplasmic protein [Chitinimonas sp. BJB300]|uniref:substrate-binding periplasmic protein n=1 Tax=Chitinimonas sp. BJB300 TaxID=1559339 RepID=UPI000C11FE34|nr:transporter substrate-binding domain-containing protein [Chitinimonas sp. BJB300]PHV09746.1 hypothetical protein CSQ89_20015 [Chitinimonas sp. BJB300]TSJ84598.1 ABC transporter substrate-binding protein [Chitinimonas sp. BJB300]
MLIWFFRVFLAVLLTTSTAFSADKPPVVKLCTEDTDSYPWLLKNRPGLNVIMLQMVAKRLEVKLDIKPLPWKRCMALVKSGAMDGIFKISYKADRKDLGHYPMIGDKADPSKRMLDDSYSLYRLKGSDVEWNGKAILNAIADVGAQSGFSIVDQLKDLGVAVDDSTRVAKENLQKLLLSRVSAVALQTLEGDNVVASNVEMRDKIERLNPPLVEKPYYLMLSKTFVSLYREFSIQIWDAIAEVRESPEYKMQVTQFN